MRIRAQQRRQGYTLVELLVSMALIMAIMAILSEAFVVGLDTFRKLKAVADMAESLRNAAAVLRRDLNSDHFDARIRPSDPLFGSTVKPREGYILIYQGGAAVADGTQDGVTTYHATNHVLQMAVKLRGNRQADFFSALVPAGSPLLGNTTFFNQPPDARYQQNGMYYSQWAEVAYYLQPLGTSATIYGASPTPLYGLYRTQRLLTPNASAANGQVAAGTAGYSQISVQPGSNPMVFNQPSDVMTVANRSFVPANLLAGTDGGGVDQLLVSNVTSFTVRTIGISQNAIGAGQGNFALAYPIGGYDSANAGGNLFGVEITIRVWDLKTQQTRQVTIIQDL
jgi:type II secretory pathway pseudopilin PulG